MGECSLRKLNCAHVVVRTRAEEIQERCVALSGLCRAQRCGRFSVSQRGGGGGVHGTVTYVVILRVSSEMGDPRPRSRVDENARRARCDGRARARAMTGTHDGEGMALTKAGVGEALNRNVKHTNRNERARSGPLCLTSTQTRRKEGNRPIFACPQRGQTQGVIYAAGKDTTSMLRSDG